MEAKDQIPKTEPIWDVSTMAYTGNTKKIVRELGPERVIAQVTQSREWNVSDSIQKKNNTKLWGGEGVTQINPFPVISYWYLGFS